MNIVIEEIVNNLTLQIEEVVSTVVIEISEMQVPGADGKSAYQSALDGGFVGTELEFNQFLSEVGNKVDKVNGYSLTKNDFTDALKASYDSHLIDTSNPHNVTKAQIGLNNVDNTSDANKPISTATQTALNTKSSLIQVDTYALMLAISITTELKIVKVLNDENKGITNTIYHLYPDGVRMWIASVQDN